MAKFTRFEEIEAWQLSRELVNLAYDLAERGPFRRDFGFRDQVCRAAVSIMSNIAEGFDSGGNRTFRRYLMIAKASAGEVRSQLYVARDRRYITENDFNTAVQLADRIARKISNLAHYLSTENRLRP